MVIGVEINSFWSFKEACGVDVEEQRRSQSAPPGRISCSSDLQESRTVRRVFIFQDPFDPHSGYKPEDCNGCQESLSTETVRAQRTGNRGDQSEGVENRRRPFRRPGKAQRVRFRRFIDKVKESMSMNKTPQDSQWEAVNHYSGEAALEKICRQFSHGLISYSDAFANASAAQLKFLRTMS